jgi:hypothetical protein
MKTDDYLPRPTIAQMRKDQNTKVWTVQLVPEQFFAPVQFGWTRTQSSWNYLKNAPLIDLYRGGNEAQVIKHYQSQPLLESLIAAIDQLKEIQPSAIAPGMSFRPVIADRQPRIIYWDDLCAGAILAQTLGEKIKVRPYEQAQGAKEFGASYFIDFPNSVEENAEVETFLWSKIPSLASQIQEERNYVIASTSSTEWQTTATDRAKLNLHEIDGNERKIFDAIALAGYFAILKNNKVAKQYSMIPHPTQELIDIYLKCRNNLIMNVRETSEDAKPKEYHANKGEINRILGQKIKQNPNLLRKK